jgi:putative SOS response-associated peptidase YedK
MIDVVVDRGKGCELVSMRFGLIPSWSKQEANKAGSTWNARCEEAASNRRNLA